MCRARSSRDFPFNCPVSTPAKKRDGAPAYRCGIGELPKYTLVHPPKAESWSLFVTIPDVSRLVRERTRPKGIILGRLRLRLCEK